LRKPKLLIWFVASIAATAALGVGVPARADVPQREQFAFEFPYVDTWTCPGLAIDATFAVRGIDTVFSATRENVHLHGLTTLSANGKTLASNFNVLLVLDPTTTLQKIAGTVWNIEVAHAGNLLVDAGTIVMDVSTSPPTVLQIGGPHPQFYGDLGALCAYLAAP
jgi:hypothetical protein